jgi:hypothetical protein
MQKQMVLTRVNKITGVAYKDEPTIYLPVGARERASLRRRVGLSMTTPRNISIKNGCINRTHVGAVGSKVKLFRLPKIFPLYDGNA